MKRQKSFLQRSLQAKLVLAAGLCLLIFGGVMIAYAALTSTANAVASAKQAAADLANAQAQDIEARVDLAMTTARTLSQSLAATKEKDHPIQLTRDQVNGMLLKVLADNPTFLATYTLWEPNAFDGKDSAYANQPGHDATGRFIPYWNRGGAGGAIILDPLVDYETPGAGDYYLVPKNSRQESIIEPYIYPVGGKDTLMTSLIVPIVVDGKFYGIAGVDIALDSLQKITDGVDFYDKTGRVEIISNGGILAASTGKAESDGKNIKEVDPTAWRDFDQIQGGKQFTNIDGGELEVYTPVQIGQTTTPWSVRLAIPYEKITAKANQDAMKMVGIALALILAGLLAIWFLIGKIAIQPLKIMTGALQNLEQGNLNRDIPQAVKESIMNREDEIGLAGKGLGHTEIYLTEMAEIATRVAKGDLTANVTPRSDKDELGKAIAQMIARLREMVGQITENAASLSAASEQLATSAAEAGSATNQIAATIQQVARGTAQQTEASTRTAAAVEQMGRAIEGVAKGAQEQAGAVGNASQLTNELSQAVHHLAQTAREGAQGGTAAAQASKEGVQTVKNTILAMQGIKTKVGLSAQKVEEMGQRSKQIGLIVETIDDIAGQTNLLALNAAIEAARAGEHGKGFAVVADEVRKLAERASASTREISTLIAGIKKTVEEAVAAMQAGALEVENGAGAANQAGAALNKIYETAEQVYTGLSGSIAIADKAIRASEELVSAMDSVSAVVEENTAATEEMAANSGEVTQAIENIASVGEENSAAVEEVSASTEEMSAQVQEVTASAQSLAAMAQSLREVVNQFSLREEFRRRLTGVIRDLQNRSHKMG